MLLKSQLCWAGHVARMEGDSLLKMVLYGELTTGYPTRGGPKKRYKDLLNKSLTACHIDHCQWTVLSSNGDAWRQTVHQAVSTFWRHPQDGPCSQKGAEEKPWHRSTTPNHSFPCSHCSRACLSRISLISHQRACSRCGQHDDDDDDVLEVLLYYQLEQGQVCLDRQLCYLGKL